MSTGPLGYRTWSGVSPIQGGSESWLGAGEIRPYPAVLNPDPTTIVVVDEGGAGVFDLLLDTPATFDRIQDSCATFELLGVG